MGEEIEPDPYILLRKFGFTNKEIDEMPPRMIEKALYEGVKTSVWFVNLFLGGSKKREVTKFNPKHEARINSSQDVQAFGAFLSTVYRTKH